MNQKLMKNGPEIILLALLILIPFLSPLFSEEYKMARSIKEACEDVNVNQETLVIFDIDNVLIASQSAIMRPIGDEVRNRFYKEYFDPLTLPEKMELQSIIWLQQKFRLTDADIPSVIHRLQAQGVPIIALTALGTGSFGRIPDMADYRIGQLHKFSIDFDLSAPRGTFIFKELHEVYGNYPLYKNGILFTNWYQNKKGDVLAAFLREVKWKPKKVIFFDDSAANLNSVGEKLTELNIEFIGIQYVSKISLFDHLDVNVVKNQFINLCKNKKWLDDEEIVK